MKATQGAPLNNMGDFNITYKVFIPVLLFFYCSVGAELS